MKKSDQAEVEEMDLVLAKCRALIEANDVPSAISHFQAKMKCSEEEATQTVGLTSPFYESVKELQD